MTRLSPDQVQVTLRAEDRYWIYAKWTTSGGIVFNTVRESFRAAFPSRSGVKWGPGTKEWRIPERLHVLFHGWLARTFDPEAVQWSAAYDPFTRERHQDVPRRPTAPSDDDPYATLHLRPRAPLWACEAVYRAAVKQCHPDVGGDHAQAVAINRAIEAIRGMQTLQARAS